jgi:DNA/RNA-binding domain of Phe-tRNA-synthetase-like protein
MKFSISEEIIKNYSDLKIGVFYIRDVSVKKEDQKIEIFIQGIENKILTDLSISALDNIPSILIWREIYQSFGSSPKKFSSIELLIRKILDTKRLPRINSLVDLYNGISAKYLLPMAAYDMYKIVGDIELRYSKKGEEFIPLGLTQIEKTKDKEVIYADAQKVICRRWNNQDCDQTKITYNSKNIIFFIDGAPNIPLKNVEQALIELDSCMQEFFGKTGNRNLIIPKSGQTDWVII